MICMNLDLTVAAIHRELSANECLGIRPVWPCHGQQCNLFIFLSGRILPKCTWITRSHTCTSSNRATSYIARDHCNVTSMLHLVEYVKELGSLDKFSAFLFENYLQHLERVVRSRSPCGMCLARLSEWTTGWRSGTMSWTGHSHPNTHELITVSLRRKRCHRGNSATITFGGATSPMPPEVYAGAAGWCNSWPVWYKHQLNTWYHNRQSGDLSTCLLYLIKLTNNLPENYTSVYETNMECNTSVPAEIIKIWTSEWLD